MKKDLERLKSELLAIANPWYLGEDVENSVFDDEFDKLEMDIKLLDPTWDYREHIKTDGVDVPHHLPQQKVTKVREKDKTMDELREEFGVSGKVNGPKYDGSGIILYYTRAGALYDALTMSSVTSGKRQLHKVKSMVPNNVTPGISSIQVEAIVPLDRGFGDGSRGKANGMVNSNSKQEECEALLCLVAIDMQFYDDTMKNNKVSYIKSLPVVRNKGVVNFIPTPFSRGTYDRNRFTCSIPEYPNFGSLIDGIVHYPKGKSSIAYKMYFNDKKDTVISEIEWNLHHEAVKYVPKYRFPTVVLDGTQVSRASVGGTAELQRKKAGVGAKVDVIKAGLTIPQIRKVFTESEDFCLPITCKCGEELSLKNELNGGLYCPNEYCSAKIDHHLECIARDFMHLLEKGDREGIKQEILSDPVRYIVNYLKVPRFNPKNLREGFDIETFGKLALQVILDPASDKDLESLMVEFFHMSGLQIEVMRMFKESVVRAYRNVI